MTNEADDQAEYLYSIEYRRLPNTQRYSTDHSSNHHRSTDHSSNHHRATDHGGSLTDRSGRRTLNKVSPRIDTTSNLEHLPGGGDVIIPTNRLDWSQAQARVKSKANIGHVPSGGIAEIPNRSLHYRQRAKAKVDSWSNSEHQPGGGDFKIRSRHLAWDAPPTVPTGTSPTKQTPSPTLTLSHPVKYSVGSRIGSLQNADHTPGGGQKVIFDEKPRWTGRSKVGSLDNIEHQPGGGGIDITDHPVHYTARSKVGSLQNADYKPRTPAPRTYDHTDSWSGVKGRVGSRRSEQYRPGGGHVDVRSEARKYLAKARIGALENLHFDPAQGKYLEMARKYQRRTKRDGVEDSDRRVRPEVIHEQIQYKVSSRINSIRKRDKQTAETSPHRTDTGHVQIRTALKDRR